MTIEPTRSQSIMESHPERPDTARYTCLVDGCNFRSRWLPGSIAGILADNHDRRHSAQRDANATNHVLADVKGYKVVCHTWSDQHKGYKVFAAKHVEDEEYEYVVAHVTSLDAVEFIDPMKTKHFSLACKYFEDTIGA